jgi:hypothetical protein
MPENSSSQRFDTATSSRKRFPAISLLPCIKRINSIHADWHPGQQKLTDASATYAINGAPAQAVQISMPLKLIHQINFQYGMNLASPALGQETFTADGKVSSTGLLSSNIQSNLYGAISNDGTKPAMALAKPAGGKVAESLCGAVNCTSRILTRPKNHHLGGTYCIRTVAYVFQHLPAPFNRPKNFRATGSGA